MKIVHICMVDAFSDGWSYHRNIISEKNKADGNDVTIITSRYSMGVHGENVKEKVGTSYTKGGVKVVRLEDALPLCPKEFQGRVRWTKGLFEALCEEKPDVMMVHNLQFFNLGEIVKYKNIRKNVKLIGDTHAMRANSLPKGSIRALIMHRIVYRYLINKYFQYFDKFGYISVYEKIFFEKMYGIDLKDAELIPLPSVGVSREDKLKFRSEIRKKHSISEDTVLFVHSGRLMAEKRTFWIFRALKNSNIKCKLFIIGSIPDARKERFEKYLREDERIEYLGWMDAEELRSYLAAADLYLQPGSVSVTYHNAMAAGTPVMAHPFQSYREIARGGEIFVESPSDIKKVFDKIENDSSFLGNMSLRAYETADQFFSVEKNAEFVYL